MLFGVGDTVATGAFRAFKQAKRPAKDVFIGGMDGDKAALQLIAQGGAYRASSALAFSTIGRAVVNLPANILRTGKAANIVVQPVLVDTPAKARAFIKREYGG
jgi:ABC-type sugar transport system substrate-binding protein